MYAGKAFATVRWTGGLQVASLRPNVFAMGAREEGRQAQVTKGTVDVAARARVTKVEATAAGKVELTVWSVEGANNTRKDRVFAKEQKGAPGAATWTWDGRGNDGKTRPRGRYVAELVMRDARGKIIQKVHTLFFQDSELEQKKRFAEIEGNLALRGGAGIAANTTVELVDKDGQVVQTVRSTAQGNYRFKSVAAGSYRVRATKTGWTSQEAAVDAAPAAAPAKANMEF